MRRSCFALMLPLALALAACDASPSDPLDPRTDLAPLLRGGTEGGAAGLSLPGLVHAAVHRVWSEHGASAARGLVADLRRLQEEADAGRNGLDADVTALRANAARMEELRIVLHVFGAPIILRVMDAVQREADALAAELAAAEASGALPPRARESLDQVRSQLAIAHAESARDAIGALDAATRAAAAADALRLILNSARRLSDVDDLFDDAALRMQAELGPDAARDALAEYNRLRREGDATVRSGDRQRAHDALKAVRVEQIRVILDVLGPPAVGRLLDDARNASAELDAQLGHARAAGRDVSRLERMSSTAADMLSRARAALGSDDPAVALDLASHAAGLINAARLAAAQ